jgi:transcriptional regulator with XRE-family HTH domain
MIERVKLRRKELGLSQRDLGIRSGVSYASLRRFESVGEISLCSLLKIANALGALLDFSELFKNKIVTNLKDYKV